MFKRFSIAAFIGLFVVGLGTTTPAFAAGFYSKTAAVGGGGWHDGLYVQNLLEQQYAQGWGYGD